MSRWAAPQGSAPPHRAGRHRHPPRPGGQGLPPPRPPGSNGSGTSPTSARGSDSCIWPPFWTAATRESRRLRHGRQHEDRPDLQGHRVWPCAAAPTRRRSRSSTRGRGSQYTSQQFAKHLKNYKILPSVGRTGVCWDNAWAQVLQRHPGRTNASTPVVHHHTGKGHQRCCLVDRTDLQSYATPLGTGVPHPQRGRTRAEQPETSGLRPPKTTVRRTPSTPNPNPQAAPPPSTTSPSTA